MVVTDSAEFLMIFDAHTEENLFKVTQGNPRTEKTSTHYPHAKSHTGEIRTH